MKLYFKFLIIWQDWNILHFWHILLFYKHWKDREKLAGGLDKETSTNFQFAIKTEYVIMGKLFQKEIQEV